MDLAYAPRHPSGDLAGLLVCQWDARMHGDHVMVPDGCIELMWLEGRGLLVCGPETEAWPVHHPQPVMAAGVRFRPGSASHVLAVPAGEITDQRLRLGDLLPSSTARSVTAQVEDADPARRSDVIAGFVKSLLNDRDDPPAATRLKAEAVCRSSGLAELADAFGTTTRTLHRWSNTTFGYGPATLRSILRLQRALAVHKAMPSIGLAELAVRAGYVDQAHFGKEARTRAGMTPRQLLASPSADWHGDGAVVDVRSVQDWTLGAPVGFST